MHFTGIFSVSVLAGGWALLTLLFWSHGTASPVIEDKQQTVDLEGLDTSIEISIALLRQDHRARSSTVNWNLKVSGTSVFSAIENVSVRNFLAKEFPEQTAMLQLLSPGSEELLRTRSNALFWNNDFSRWELSASSRKLILREQEALGMIGDEGFTRRCNEICFALAMYQHGLGAVELFSDRIDFDLSERELADLRIACNKLHRKWLEREISDYPEALFRFANTRVKYTANLASHLRLIKDFDQRLSFEPHRQINIFGAQCKSRFPLDTLMAVQMPEVQVFLGLDASQVLLLDDVQSSFFKYHTQLSGDVLNGSTDIARYRSLREEQKRRQSGWLEDVLTEHQEAMLRQLILTEKIKTLSRKHFATRFAGKQFGVKDEEIEQWEIESSKAVKELEFRRLVQRQHDLFSAVIACLDKTSMRVVKNCCKSIEPVILKKGVE